MSDSSRLIKSYVIRAARMSEAQKSAYDRLSPRWVLAEGVEVDWNELFPRADRRVVEIGFGMGDATRRLALEKPAWGILGIEVHRPGIGKLLWWMEKENIDNIRIIEGDAAQVVERQLAPESVDLVNIWFPDPWPKKRHHKRRLLQPDFIDKVTKIIKKGGRVHIATDWESYADQIMINLSLCKGLKNIYKKWAPKPEYRPDTKFERKGIHAERTIRDIIFAKE